jgi:O-antigen/teichoic acid export membrane protein
MLGAVHVGHYAAAVKISEAYYFLPLIIATSVFPAIINAKKISEKLYTERLQNLHLILLWMSVAVALLFTFIGESLIALLFGAAYLPAGQVLIVHVWGGVFVSVSIASKRWFIVEELQHLLLVRALISTACNIILNLVLIPKYGILGSAVATLISLCLVWFTYLFNPRLWTVFIFTIKSIFPIYLFRKN